MIVKTFGENTPNVTENFSRFFATSSERSVAVPVGKLTLNKTNSVSDFFFFYSLYDRGEEGLRSSFIPPDSESDLDSGSDLGHLVLTLSESVFFEGTLIP